MTTDDVFDAAHALVAQWEGGLSDDAADSGGVTNFGVSLVFLNDLVRSARGVELLNVVGLSPPVSREMVISMVTPEIARELFHAVFWVWPGINRLKPLQAVACYVFGVNAGAGRSVQLLQQVLGVSADGVIGPKTLAAATSGDDYATATAVIDRQESYYRGIVTARPSQGVFLKGWLNRTHALRNLIATLAMGNAAGPEATGDDLRHFMRAEFACNCGCGQGADRMDARLLAQLDAARDAAGIPFVVSSGFRCEAHNRDVGGVDGSAHVKGQAVDLRCRDSRQRFALLSALLSVGFQRIELAPTWIHVDVDDSKPQGVAFYQAGGNYR